MSSYDPKKFAASITEWLAADTPESRSGPIQLEIRGYGFLSAHVHQLAQQNDPRLMTLYACQPAGVFDPGPRQRNALGLAIGSRLTVDRTPAAFDSLVAAALEDGPRWKDNDELSRAWHKLNKRTDDLRRLDAFQAQAERASLEAETALNERDRLAGRVSELEQELVVFRRALGAGMSPKRDRQPVDGEPHIYDRISTKGEATFYVRVGTRFENAGKTIEEAREKRDALVAEGAIREPVPA